MVDGILIILLSMVAILILVQYILFSLAKQEKCFCRPTPSHEEIIAIQSLFEYFCKHPSSEMTGDFPHLAAVAEATREYTQLNDLYEHGMIDEIEYNLQLEKLLPKVNIENDF